MEILKIDRLRVDSSMIKMNFYDIPNTYFVIYPFRPLLKDDRSVMLSDSVSLLQLERN